MAATLLGISVVGADGAGIIAAFTRFVFRRGGNIHYASENVVGDLFGMYLEARFGGGTDVGKFRKGIGALARRHRMEVAVYDKTGSDRRIAVLVTSEPHCLRAILAARKRLAGTVSVVVGTERSLEPAARRAGVPFVAVEERRQDDAEKRLLSVCRERSIDLIVLARYMRILTPNFVWRYPNRIINIHPSLLPAFPGAIAYAQAFERGTKIAGVTAHYVTESLDQGPIILQDSFRVDPGTTLEDMKARGRKLEASALLRAVRLHLENRLEVRWRKVHVLPGAAG